MSNTTILKALLKDRAEGMTVAELASLSKIEERSVLGSMYWLERQGEVTATGTFRGKVNARWRLVDVRAPGGISYGGDEALASMRACCVGRLNAKRNAVADEVIA